MKTLSERPLRLLRRALLAMALGTAALAAQALELRFQKVAEGVYAHVGDTGARSAENEGLNANIARAHTQSYLLALRAHMKKAVDDSGDVSAAVKSFDAKTYMRLLNAAELMPGNASRTYLELERE